MLMVMPSAAQLLYRISGNGLQKESFVIGTYHLADDSFVDKIPGARDALNNVEQVYGELEMDAMENPDSMALLQKHMMLPDGKTIRDVLTKEQFGKVDDFFESVMGVRLREPLVMMQMGKMSPSAIFQTLSLMMDMKHHLDEFNPMSGIDSYFQKAAHEMGKPVKGFETVAFQAATLFDDDMETQVKGLMCLVDNHEFYDLQSELLIKAYFEQDLDGVMAHFNETLGNDCDSSDDQLERILYQRNDNWMRQIPTIMSEHSTLFVVGAAHLGGERGLLSQLISLGYAVEGVK